MAPFNSAFGVLVRNSTPDSDHRRGVGPDWVQKLNFPNLYELGACISIGFSQFSIQILFYSIRLPAEDHSNYFTGSEPANRMHEET